MYSVEISDPLLRTRENLRCYSAAILIWRTSSRWTVSPVKTLDTAAAGLFPDTSLDLEPEKDPVSVASLDEGAGFSEGAGLSEGGRSGEEGSSEVEGNSDVEGMFDKGVDSDERAVVDEGAEFCELFSEASLSGLTLPLLGATLAASLGCELLVLLPALRADPPAELLLELEEGESRGVVRERVECWW